MDGFNKRANAEPQKLENTENGNVSANTFSVQSNRITSREQTYLKIKGAFKIKVENKGDVGITIFENFEIPSYASEPFETGDTNLGFIDHTKIQYDNYSVGENIDIHLTAYFRTK